MVCPWSCSVPSRKVLLALCSREFMKESWEFKIITNNHMKLQQLYFYQYWFLKFIIFNYVYWQFVKFWGQQCLYSEIQLSLQISIIQKPLYKTIYYSMVSDIIWLQNRPKNVVYKQKCTDYIEHLWSCLYIIYTFYVNTRQFNPCRAE